MPSEYYTTGDIAKLCDVTANGVIKWIKAGKLKAFKTPGGQRRIREEDFRDFLHQFDYPINPKFARKGSTTRVLIVDDDRSLVKLMKTYLVNEGGLEVSAAYNGYEGCIKAGSFRPDVVLLDIMMPKIDGYEVLRQLREAPETKDTQVIIITALNKEVIRERLPFDVVIQQKPVDFADMLSLIQSYVKV